MTTYVACSAQQMRARLIGLVGTVTLPNNTGLDFPPRICAKLYARVLITDHHHTMPRTNVSKKLTDADIEAAFPSSPRHVRVTANIVTVTSSDGNISNLPEESEEECSPDGEVDYQSLAEKVDVDHWLSSLGDYLIYSNNHLKREYTDFRKIDTPRLMHPFSFKHGVSTL